MDFTQFNVPLFFVGFTSTVVVYLLLDKRRKAAQQGAFASVEGRAGPDVAAPAAAPSPAGPQKAAPGSARPPELVNGFRDLRWGDAPTPGMDLLRSDGDEALYMRAGDVMRVGGGQLLRVNYQFRDGKLAGVVLQIEPGSLGKVMDELRIAYGRPSKPKGVDTKFYWLEGAETQAMLEADQEKQSGTVVIFRKPAGEKKKT